MDSPRDSVSNLPDEILGKIQSSVLSKRWRNLVVLVDTLCFDESMVFYPNKEEAKSGSHRFYDFVVKTCSALFTNNTPFVKKLSLCHVSRPLDHNEELYGWIWRAIERCGLLELHLDCSRWVVLQRVLLTSNTLVKLTLSGVYSLEVQRVFLPALKSLSLLIVYFLDQPNYCRLVDGCPVLEELFITDADHDTQSSYGTTVESESIKRLVVSIDLPDSQEYHDLAYIHAPSLVHLDYSSYVSQDYQFVDLGSLVEARLNLRLWESTNDYDYYSDDDDDCYYDSDDDDDDEPKESIFGDVTELVAGISNITTLHLSPDSLEAFHFCCKSMPVFNNLLKVSIESHKEKGWKVMPLLQLCSRVVQIYTHYSSRVTNRCGDACACSPKKKHQSKKRKIIVKEEILSCLWTCQVMVLEISEYGGSFQELKQMKHFLGKLKCLQTVKFGFDAHNNNKSEFLQANLLALPRVSSNCNLLFI